MSKEIKLQLTALHPAQLEVTQQAKRFNVVCCGRRWGKTVLGMDRLIHPALEGKPVAWFAPNYRLLADVWRELQATLAPVITRTNQQEWRLELSGGGVVEMWSLDSPDSGRERRFFRRSDRWRDGARDSPVIPFRSSPEKSEERSRREMQIKASERVVPKVFSTRLEFGGANKTRRLAFLAASQAVAFGMRWTAETTQETREYGRRPGRNPAKSSL
jgi:hypothetical protein